ncbi:MAG TPA: alpha/beta fold hydrolase [Vicinamibacterales bacterium]|nr:alpha/beta fold hydrolase [Vicinamibacterales bacterium]
MTLPSTPFVPHPALTGGHRMTLAAWARPRRLPRLPPAESRLFQVASDSQVLGRCHWQAERAARLTVICLHGLEGSSDSHYMRGMADKAWVRGYNVVRLNQRNCGGTEHLSPGLYHSGLTADPLAVMHALAAEDDRARFAFAGYSLGGNIALKLGGELTPADAARVVAITAVSPPIELAHCVDALERPVNFAYHLNFLVGLRGRMRRKARLYPDVYDLAALASVRSVRAFDDAYTAPHSGFADAADYYHRASSRRVLPQLAVPALLVTAADDPFVPPDAARDPVLAEVPLLTRIVTRHGGHCGFIGRPAAPGDDGYWAETTAMEFITDAATAR